MHAFWELAQGEAIDSALEGEDDESKIEQEVSMVIAELQLVMVGQGSVRYSSPTSFYLLLLYNRFLPTLRHLRSTCCFCHSLLPSWPHCHRKGRLSLALAPPPLKLISKSASLIFEKTICERVFQSFKRISCFEMNWEIIWFPKTE
jgi:hypothetical protein